jgi:hypothetical protein
MKVDFHPLRHDAIAVLSAATGIDYSRTEFSREHEWFCCTSRNEFNQVALVIVFEFKSELDAHVSTVLVDHRALTRRLLTAVITAVFQRAARITALVEPTNEVAIGQMWRMGFKHEGYIRRAINGDRDALLFGLLPEECPYLVGKSFRFVRVEATHPTHPGVN